ncbi:MarR family winged helix-turn-helix transcriptional regulator [Catenovulum maritimum]|uniref:HTH marR-type domain-containing protein n=1 Tax=Catenovulum maritimum TaxID=1513271 RepID=A0A0J8GV12_9ALTE|nr:MarR family winged helix-turn-helix transcriptional regulator [Catenovulum maritimum]KMT64508.1 hypothetical protein XM47_13685 [Catenovulum maritimum]
MENYEVLLTSLRRVIRAIDLYSKKLSKETGLTSSQLIIMQAVSVQPGIMVKNLAESINLSSATVTSILDRLEQKQFIKRQRFEDDKRRVGLYLAEQGEAILKNAPKALQSHFVTRFEGLEEWEQMMLMSSVQRIASMMDAESIDAAPILEIGQIQTKDIQAQIQLDEAT